MCLGTTSSLSDMLNICSSTWIKTSKLCCCIKHVDSNITFCWSSNFQFLHLNSSYEFSFSIWHFSLLEFCCWLSVHLCVSPICISWRIISLAWGILWHVGLSFIHKCFCSDLKTIIGVTNCWSSWSTFKLLVMATPILLLFM